MNCVKLYNNITYKTVLTGYGHYFPNIGEEENYCQSIESILDENDISDQKWANYPWRISHYVQSNSSITIPPESFWISISESTNYYIVKIQTHLYKQWSHTEYYTTNSRVIIRKLNKNCYSKSSISFNNYNNITNLFIIQDETKNQITFSKKYYNFLNLWEI